MNPERTTWHALSTDQILDQLDTTRDGLSDVEAKKRLEQYGANELKETARISPIIAFLNQFRSPLIYILMLAALFSFASGHPIDGFVILAIVILNAVIGFYQEYQAERALEALKKISALQATVIRDNEEVEIDSSDLVPGDIILLQTGDKIPADARLIFATNLKTDESALTGESLPVDKNTVQLPSDSPLAERSNMVYSGTAVVYGRGTAAVTETGMNTQMGKIATQVTESDQGSTPVQRRLAVLAGQLGVVGLIIAAIIIVIGLMRDFSLLDMFFVGVAAAVSFIPEGLPAVVTVVLAAGVQRMAKRFAVVRKLPAVETLGSATVICSDKTGTLTRNEMTVKTGYLAEREFTVEGEGYAPVGKFHYDNQVITHEDCPDIGILLKAFVLCSDSRLHHEENTWRVSGDPTEGALIVAGEKFGLRKHDLENEEPRVDEVPFDSEKRYMATLHKLPDGRKVAYVKGAPERILAMSSRYYSVGDTPEINDKVLDIFAKHNARMAADALRVLATAYKEFPAETHRINQSDVESGLIFIGAVGMMDPPRDEAKQAIQAARTAGIRVIMVTGDHPDTARTIGRMLGLLDNDMEVVAANTLDNMSDSELTESINRIAVFARAEPEHKIRIIRALKQNGQIVAMTGDGVNDAPALKMADIGIAMGITGTDVSKEASDMILLDDNFATIIAAVEEGRSIYANIRRVILYLLATNTGEVLIYLIGILSGLPLPLIPVQILWINLVTDGFSTVPLSMEPREEGILQEPPRNVNAPIVDKNMIQRIVFVSLFMLVGTLGLFIWELENSSLDKARTFAFVSMALFQVFNVFNVRSDKHSIFHVGIMSNPYVLAGASISVLAQIAAVHVGFFQNIFRTVPLSLAEWGVITAVASTVFIADELRKLVARKLQKES
ncbi:MAG: cation-translocating P-type ATPase [Armatimonadota bacterium]